MSEEEELESFVSGKLMEERMKKIMVNSYNKRIKYNKKKKTINKGNTN